MNVVDEYEGTELETLVKTLYYEAHPLGYWENLPAFVKFTWLSFATRKSGYGNENSTR